jgi:hypothetical protein
VATAKVADAGQGAFTVEDLWTVSDAVRVRDVIRELWRRDDA